MRILFDTNVWSRLADGRHQNSLHELVLRTGSELVVSPATLLEVLNGRARRSRQTRVNLMSRDRWTRLPTEAFSEAHELIEQIRRLRPQWARDSQPGEDYKRYERFWSQDIWERARRGLFEVPPRTRAGENAAIKSLTTTQRQMQDAVRQTGEARSVEAFAHMLTTVKATPHPDSDREPADDGWNPDIPVDPWRLETLAVMWRAIGQVNGDGYGDSTYIDWLDPFVDLEQVRADQPGFGRMLLYEAEASEMVRSWVRWAVRFLQIAARVQTSNPVDEQVSAYLPDADLFFTADKALYRILTAVQMRAPGPCATPHLVVPEGVTPITAQVEAAIVARKN